MNKKFFAGQSVVEVIIAISIIVIIAASSVVAVLGTFSTNRLGEEESQAAYLAAEGMEAVQSIRNQGWSGLTDGTHGLINTSGVWEFSGSEDTDPSGKFTRTVEISPVIRNLNEDIVSSGGAVDPDTKKVMSTVSWNFTVARQNTVSYTSYLTNWQNAVDPETASGPDITSCAQYCEAIGYPLGGVCRKNSSECVQNGETYVQPGDQFCTSAPNDTCCCTP